MMKPLWNLSKVKNLSNVQNVNFGYRKMKDVIIWLANVNSNFVTNVEEYIWNVNVWLKCNNKCKGEGLRLNKEEKRNNKWCKKEKIKNNKYCLKEAGEEKNEISILLCIRNLINLTSFEFLFF
jgi:hypothetical protein